MDDDTNIGFNSSGYWRIHADTISNKEFVGNFRQMLFINEFVDLETDAGLNAIHTAAGAFVDFGSDGSNVTGNAAQIMFRGDASTINGGTGNGGDGGSISLNGSVTDPSTAHPTDLFQSAEAGFFWNTTDADDLYQGVSLSTPVTTDGQSVRSIADSSGNGNNGQSDSGEEPTWSESDQALQFNGSTQGMPSASWTTSGAATYNFACAIKTTDTAGIILSVKDANSPFVGAWQDTSTSGMHSNSGSPSVYVDGSLVSGDRDALHTAIADGFWHLVEVRGLASATFWNSVRPILGQYNSNDATFGVNGDIGSPYITTHSTTATLDDVRDWYAAQYGITLV